MPLLGVTVRPRAVLEADLLAESVLLFDFPGVPSLPTSFDLLPAGAPKKERMSMLLHDAQRAGTRQVTK